MLERADNQVVMAVKPIRLAVSKSRNCSVVEADEALLSRSRHLAALLDELWVATCRDIHVPDVVEMGGGADLPAVLTVDEVAELLRVDRKTAYAVIAEGGVPGVRRLGRCIRVSRDSLMQWLAEGDAAPRRRRRAA